MNLDKLKGAVPQQVIDELPLVMTKADINTPFRLAHFLGQCSHESGNFTVKTENLNYSAQGLVSTFKKYFPTLEAATPYSRQPQKIANKVYANRMGNGDEKSGMGWKYRGNGYIQLTGFDNYKRFDTFVDDDIVNNPELVATKYPLLSAAWFWNVNQINVLADKGINTPSITAVTKKINGGTIGLTHRIEMTNKFYTLLS